MGIHLELLTFWSDGSQTIPKLSYNFVMGFLQIDDHNTFDKFWILQDKLKQEISMST